MTFKELAEKRCSIRKFADEPVDHEMIVEVLKEAQRAPSWKNTQTARAYIVEPGEKLEELSFVTETYLKAKTERKYKTLEFFNSLRTT